MSTEVSRRSRRVRAAAMAIVLGMLLVLPLAGQSQETVDLQAIYKIKEEGLQRSKVMEVASYLTDVYGPRLTGSPAIRTAAEWAVKQMQGWGLSNAKLEPWGQFGRGWSNDRFVGHMLTPSVSPLIGAAKPWTPGTNGAIKGDAVLAALATDADLDAFKGKLRGKFVLTMPARVVAARFDPLARRFTDAELADLAKQPVAAGRGRGGPPGPQPAQGFAQRRTAFLVSEGVAGTVEMSNGDGGTIFVQSGGSRSASDPPTVPQVVLAVEHYNRIARILDKKIPVTLEFDVKNTFYDSDLSAFNIVAELPGTDKADEIVMVGAHFDSWASGTGATDNAAGSAVMMEAIRLIQASGLKPRRTIRIGLWTGEEQGLFGSREYVARHLGERVFHTDSTGFTATDTVRALPAYEKHAGYFNVDNGTGKIRGIYLQGNTQVRDVFTAWIAPFRDMGVTTISPANTSGTDHQAFDAVGLAGWQFIQDPVDYGTRTHHSNQDLFERLVPDDMKHNAAVVAGFVWQAAQRGTKLPGKAGWPIVVPDKKSKPTTE